MQLLEWRLVWRKFERFVSKDAIEYQCCNHSCNSIIRENVDRIASLDVINDIDDKPFNHLLIWSQSQKCSTVLTRKLSNQLKIKARRYWSTGLFFISIKCLLTRLMFIRSIIPMPHHLGVEGFGIQQVDGIQELILRIRTSPTHCEIRRGSLVSLPSSKWWSIRVLIRDDSCGDSRNASYRKTRLTTNSPIILVTVSYAGTPVRLRATIWPIMLVVNLSTVSSLEVAAGLFEGYGPGNCRTAWRPTPADTEWRAFLWHRSDICWPAWCWLGPPSHWPAWIQYWWLRHWGIGSVGLEVPVAFQAQARL